MVMMQDNYYGRTATPEELAVMTSEQRYRYEKSRDMYIDRDILFSPAWRSLKTAACCHVYLLFLTKRVMQPSQTRGRKREYIVVNKDDLQFTWKEAKDKWGISNGKFCTAIDELVRVGLIDITHQGSGLRGEVNRYGLSDRWQNFKTGTGAFVERRREKRTTNYGFADGNKHGRNSRKNKTNIDEQQLATVADNS